MNFINSNPDNRLPDFVFKNLDSIQTTDPAYQEDISSVDRIDRTFEKMLEKASDEARQEEKVADSGEEIKEKSPSTENQEDKVENQETNSRVDKLLALLDKLQEKLQKQNLSESEQAYLFQNFNFLKQQIGELSGGKGQSFHDVANWLNNPALLKFIGGEGKLPPEILEQIKNLTNLIKHQANQSQDISSKGSSTHSLEKLGDLTQSSGDKQGSRPIKLEDIFIKTQDRFDVLKGNKTPDQASVNTKTTLPQSRSQEEYVNPTHQKASSGGLGQNSKNLVINVSQNSNSNFSNHKGGEGMPNFSGQGSSQNQAAIASQAHPSSLTTMDRASGMFSQNSLPQSMNFKTLIQHLTGRIYSGLVSGKQVMMVKLQPENLGKVQVFLKKEGENSLHLKLKVDSLEVKEILDRSSNEIRLGLNKDNLDLLSFDVDISGNPGSEANHQERSEEKKFNEFSFQEESKNSIEGNSRTVDLRMKSHLLNIRI